MLFIGDLLLRPAGDGPFGFVPDEHVDDPALTRATVRSLLDLPVTVLCPAHGAPAVGDARAAGLDALARDGA